MTKKEQKDASKQLLDIYAGILFNNQEFDKGNNREINYKFDCAEYKTLKEKYKLTEIAGNGSDFEKAKNLLHYFAPKLTHSSWYDNQISCNALDLLEYSFDNPEQGINCLNKSKILEECCLALGMYARRVHIMPYSPYDFDHHVVTEIYDRELKKWIMLDPTTDGFYVDENKMPLSLLEMRDKFANATFVTFVSSTDKLKDLNKIQNRYIEKNSYICKNLFCFFIDKDSTFGTTDEKLAFIPSNYSVKEKLISNTKYRIANMPNEYKYLIPKYESELEKLKDYKEDERTNIVSMLKSPIE